MAHKKAGGTSENLKDSNPKYRGVKLFAGQTAYAGNIIIRQKGDVYQAGVNVYKGKDFTLHATVDGLVFFRKKKFLRYDGRVYLRTVVDILSAEQIAEKKNKPAPQVKVKKAPKAPKAPLAKKPVAKKAAAPKVEKVEKAPKAPKVEKIEKAEKPVAKKAAAPKAEKAEKTTTPKKPAAPKKKAA